MFLPGNKTQGHLRWASPWFSRFGTREPGTPPAKQFRSNPRGPLQSVRSTLGFLFLLSACPGKMRPSRHSVLPAATLPRCHTAPLERGRLEQACAECRTQPIVRVYTFGERSPSKQKKMQQIQDMGASPSPVGFFLFFLFFCFCVKPSRDRRARHERGKARPRARRGLGIGMLSKVRG
jgi:hypothetical protein